MDDHLVRLLGGDPDRFADVELALQVGERRVVVARGAVVELVDTVVRWSVTLGGRVAAGVLVLAGRALALHVTTANGQGALVVLDARTGALQHRITLADTSAVRFAAGRGVAAVVLARRRIVLVDLRFGCVIASRALDRDITDLAIDDAGTITVHAGEPVALAIDELERSAPPELATEPVVVIEPPPPPVTREPAVLGPIPALPRRPSPAVPATGLLRGLLAAERGYVVALVRHALVDAPAELDEAHARWIAAIAAARPGVAPLHRLADALGLDDHEQAVLLVIAAPALWGELAPLYGQLARDPGRALCDEQLVATILATIAFPDEIARVLDPEAALCRHGLIHATTGLTRPFLALAVDPVVLRILRGDAAIDPMIRRRAAPCTFAELHVAEPVKHQLVDELARAPAPLRVVVRGRPGSGRHSLLATIAATAGSELAVIDPGLSADELRVALRRAALAGLVPCVTSEPGVDLRRVVREHAGPVFVRVASEAAVPIDPGYVDVELPLHGVAERTAVWHAALARRALVIPEIDDIAARFALEPGAIDQIAARIAHDPGPTPVVRIEAAIRQHLDRAIAAVATRVTRLPTWSHVILPADIQDSITELIARIRHKRTVFDRWGFDRVMATSRGLTALFQGGPGTGKTLVAGAIANELGLDLYRVDVSRIMSKWIGETEQNLARLFDAAHDGNAIILFDEADSLFAKRTEVKTASDRFANLEVNYLLQRLDSFAGIAILTTNFGTAIDAAFKRRLSFRLTFPFPDEEQRERLWRAHLPDQLPVRGELELARLARRYQLSGGYIRNCALRAAFLAAEQGGTLTASHLERAVQAEYRELGKLSDSGVLE
ncbi:MAG: ATP-binding protein [Kofleriaceae bacterium]